MGTASVWRVCCPFWDLARTWGAERCGDEKGGSMKENDDEWKVKETDTNEGAKTEVGVGLQEERF